MLGIKISKCISNRQIFRQHIFVNIEIIFKEEKKFSIKHVFEKTEMNTLKVEKLNIFASCIVKFR